jgi:hypothetical protein
MACLPVIHPCNQQKIPDKAKVYIHEKGRNLGAQEEQDERRSRCSHCLSSSVKFWFDRCSSPSHITHYIHPLKFTEMCLFIYFHVVGSFSLYQ